MFLRHFSKVLCFGTLFLIFAGGMVKSTDSGLAVPDWPLSYGTLFPPMVGGVFYEHGHRMIATLIGFLTLCLAVSLAYLEKRPWVKYLGFAALAAVILQGVLGGLTVLFFLPDQISIAHGLLAQTFFVLTVVIAYSCSQERARRGVQGKSDTASAAVRINVVFFFLVYTQLLIGAIMRHTEAGLAIPDFPTMGGQWLPSFDAKMLAWVNAERFDMNLEPVVLGQIVIHFLHRAFAVILLVAAIILTRINIRRYAQDAPIKRTVLLLDGFIVLQVILGVIAVLSQKEPITTSIHVTVGAGILGIGTLLVLRTAPLKWKEFKAIV